MINVYGIEPQKLMADLVCQGNPKYRGKQLLDWIYKEHTNQAELMTNLPKEFKHNLQKQYSLALPEVINQQLSADGTSKYSLGMEGGDVVEMVLIPTGTKNTLCISSQAGCARDCTFCATGKHGLKRNLQIHEIVGQIALAAQLGKPSRLTNLVFMGMGEPMDNIEAVLSSLSIIQAEQGLSFSPRRTTISTCGIIPGIIKLADSGIKTKLAVSLNSAIEEKRSSLMPVNELYPLAELKQALQYFRNKTSYRITFEYIMIPGLNMGMEDIRALKKYVTDISCKINLIPWNPVQDLAFRAPTNQEIETFVSQAQSINQAITLRKSRGADISGACGQLAYQQ